MVSKNTLRIQESRHVESKAHWAWISCRIEFIDGRWIKTKGETYIKGKK